MNPGPWVAHSRYAGMAARLISERHPELDPTESYVLGLLHDIGRRYGVTSMRHALDGFTYLSQEGYPEAGRICLTHSFPYRNVKSVFGEWDCTGEELRFVESFLQHVVFDKYDKLIQLCDALALPSGFCLLEKRLVDVVLRHGVNDFLVPKWKATFAIKQELEQELGTSVYDLLPGVVENTFGK